MELKWTKLFKNDNFKRLFILLWRLFMGFLKIGSQNYFKIMFFLLTNTYILICMWQNLIFKNFDLCLGSEFMWYVTPEPTKKRVRTRKILYFNPPFSKSVKTKFGALFLKLIDHPFPNHHIFHKIFNRSKVKISYCTMPNVKNHIAKNNAKVSSTKNDCDKNERKCDCTRKFKGKCPLHGHCLQKSVVYQAHVTTANKTMIYTGMTKNSFKQRWCVHNATIEKRPPKEKVTTLSEYVWKLKDQNIPFKITYGQSNQKHMHSPVDQRDVTCVSQKN